MALRVVRFEKEYWISVLQLTLTTGGQQLEQRPQVHLGTNSEKRAAE